MKLSEKTSCQKSLIYYSWESQFRIIELNLMKLYQRKRNKKHICDQGSLCTWIPFRQCWFQPRNLLGGLISHVPRSTFVIIVRWCRQRNLGLLSISRNNISIVNLIHQQKSCSFFRLKVEGMKYGMVPLNTSNV